MYEEPHIFNLRIVREENRTWLRITLFSISPFSGYISVGYRAKDNRANIPTTIVGSYE